MRRWLAYTATIVSTFVLLAPAAHAADTTTRGLLITPIRQFIAADAGKSAKSSFVVANLTKTNLEVNLAVRSFSVSNYDYNYSFEEPKPNWLVLQKTNLTLLPGQSQTITYSFTVPAGASPGGRYYTLIASAQLHTGGIDNTIQAANMLYVTVNGSLRKTSELTGSSIARFSFGKDIPYTLQPKNTGNVHFFAYVTGELRGLFVQPAPVPTAHVLLPNTVRTIHDSIPSPVLPGIYRATFGYKTDAGQAQTVSRYIVFIPPWSLAFLLALLLLIGGVSRRIGRSQRSQATDKPTP